MDQLELEFRAQIETVLASGLKPAHLDWHAIRLDNREEIFNLIFRLASEYGMHSVLPGEIISKKYNTEAYPAANMTFWTATF
jgi:predicted glycoside hydrolase/deacetylase ChbG (UPF0249 family)